jgi:hypothetical protein
MKMFHYKDLQKLIKQLPKKSRTRKFCQDLLDGKVVDITEIPNRKDLKWQYKSKCRNDLKRLFYKHLGIVNDGNLYWIPRFTCTTLKIDGSTIEEVTDDLVNKLANLDSTS